MSVLSNEIGHTADKDATSPMNQVVPAEEFNPDVWRAAANKLIDMSPEHARKLVTDAIAQSLHVIVRGDHRPDRFQLHTAAEALLPQPPIDWIVDHVFSAGSVSLVVGEAKSKKTYSLIDCAVAVALGEEWLGFKTKRGPVLIIDEESGTRRLNRRIGDTMRGHNAEAQMPLFYVTLAGVDLSNAADVREIESLIGKTRAQLVIIDALIDVIGNADENDASQIQAVFHALRMVAENTQAAIVVIHHAGKNGGYRGSSAMKGAVDLLLTVESKPDSPNINFDATAPRDVEPFKFAAIAIFGEATFNLSPGVQNKAAASYSKAQSFVLRYLEANGPSEITEMCSHADTCSVGAARKAIYSLVDMAKVRRADGGGSGAKAIYSLS